jgi:hypothetical protein
MHFYVRVILCDATETYSKEELVGLRSKVESDPCVEKIKKVERHSRGGYSVEVDLLPNKAEEFTARLATHGYSSVI